MAFIEIQLIQWFKSYLDNCKQNCFINESSSDKLPLGCSVPQRTILGPLLFLIYGSVPFNQSKTGFCDRKLDFPYHLWRNQS